MNFTISFTQKGIREIPMHKHSELEISFYADTYGELRTPDGNYRFCPGSIVIIPSDTFHSSHSETELNVIYLRGKFNSLFHLDKPIVLKDNEEGEASQLVKLIYNNRYGNKEYLSALCDAYVHLLASNIKFEDEIGKAINQIIENITHNAFEPDISIAKILRNTGYAEDYIRSKFKKATLKTPTELLTDIRISHACFLIEVYGETYPLSQIAEKCGYTDYVYFSKKFKELTGVPPKKYKGDV